MVLTAIKGALLLIPVLVNVAFFTLLERKVLGLSQLRKGPNKVSSVGLLQPMADAVKLFLKEFISPSGSSGAFLLSPMLGIGLALVVWEVAPGGMAGAELKHSAIFLLVVLSLGLYPLLLAGWASNSKYALVGAIRGVAQTISYEISLALLLLAALLGAGTAGLGEWATFSGELIFGLLVLPLTYFWVVSCVAETNRTPFDFAEGESELVSGFNIEYGGGGFALIFMAEYASIMFLCLLTASLLGCSDMGSMSTPGSVVFLAFFWVWVRATLPRFRYDKLMSVAWKSILPSALSLLLGVSAMASWGL